MTSELAQVREAFQVAELVVLGMSRDSPGYRDALEDHRDAAQAYQSALREGEAGALGPLNPT